MTRQKVKIHCFAIPLTFIIAIPLVATPTALVAWRFSNTSNENVETPTIWFDVEVIRGDGGPADGEGLRPEAPATEPRPLRGSVHVRKDPARTPDPLVLGQVPPSDAQNGSLLLRSVPRDVPDREGAAGEEGSGDAAEGGLFDLAGPASEEGPPDPHHH